MNQFIAGSGGARYDRSKLGKEGGAMLRIFVALVFAAAMLLVASALSGSAIQTGPASVRALLGLDRGALRLVP